VNVVGKAPTNQLLNCARQVDAVAPAVGNMAGEGRQAEPAHVPAPAHAASGDAAAGKRKRQFVPSADVDRGKAARNDPPSKVTAASAPALALHGHGDNTGVPGPAQPTHPDKRKRQFQPAKEGEAKSRGRGKRAGAGAGAGTQGHTQVITHRVCARAPRSAHAGQVVAKPGRLWLLRRSHAPMTRADCSKLAALLHPHPGACV